MYMYVHVIVMNPKDLYINVAATLHINQLATNYRALLGKMTCKDNACNASYRSSPLCTFCTNPCSYSPACACSPLCVHSAFAYTRACMYTDASDAGPMLLVDSTGLAQRTHTHTHWNTHAHTHTRTRTRTHTHTHTYTHTYTHTHTRTHTHKHTHTHTHTCMHACPHMRTHALRRCCMLLPMLLAKWSMATAHADKLIIQTSCWLFWWSTTHMWQMLYALNAVSYIEHGTQTNRLITYILQILLMIHHTQFADA